MSAVLTPGQAIAYLRELDPTISAARIADRAGATVASYGSPGALEQPTAIRIREGEYELIAVADEGAIEALVRADAAAALAGVRCRC
jgi:hypothetical protein